MIMQNKGDLKVTTPSDREIQMTRLFNAPREMVYKAFTTPDLLKRWVAPGDYIVTECSFDARPGGKFRFVMQGTDGSTVAWGGMCHEVVAPERIVHTESFDDYPGESQVTTVWTEEGGKTRLTLTMLFASREVRDMVIQSGMEHGAAMSYDQLEELLAKQAA